VNLSLSENVMPSKLNEAILSPLLKKLTLDNETFKHFRPVSNLAYISKLIERIVAVRLTNHMNENGLHEMLQSSYKNFFSTETVTLKVQNDILQAIDNQKCVALILLDLSAAFDTVDHEILLTRMETRLGITGNALQWFRSYLSDRTQAVSINGAKSQSQPLKYGVPQGSVLGPLLFLAYVLPLGDIIREDDVSFHFYADDTQLYISFDISKGNGTKEAMQKVEKCIVKIMDWMAKNFLKLNGDKTEVLILGSPYNLRNLEIPELHIGDNTIKPSISVRNIGAIFDASMTMEAHVNTVCRCAYLHIRNISRIRKYLTRQAVEILIHAFVTTKLDFMNALLVGLPKKLLYKLQKVQNIAARIITNTKRFDHITPVLQSLHWLPVKQHITYKVMVLTYRSLNGLAPNYLKDLLTYYEPVRRLRSSSQMLLDKPATRTNYGARAFSKAAPVIWNELPLELRQSPSLNIFKKSLKTYLLKEAFEL
jgi:hypothetical protein